LISRRSLLLAPVALAAQSRKPNILLFLAPQWRGVTTVWNGDPDAPGIAPNLEKFAKSAVVYTRVYSASPARDRGRTALLTGRYPHASGEAEFATDRVKVVDASAPAPPARTFAVHLRQNVTGPGAEEKLAKYYAGLSDIDAAFGEFLAGAPADAIVVFTSDRGVQMGSQGMDGDDQPYEESLRVPLAIRYPGGRGAGTASGGLLSTIDLLPSLVENGEPPAHSESIYAEGGLGRRDEWRVVVRGYDKLVFTPDGRPSNLYNLADDPYEMMNLVSEPGAKLTVASMTALARVWMRKVADRVDPSGLKKRK
jgi:arylsulfatase A-like enzyme